MFSKKTTLGIIGNGPASLAALSQLHAQHVQNVKVIIFSKSRLAEVEAFPPQQRLRIQRLRLLGIDACHLIGAGAVWNPADPASFSVNGGHGGFSANVSHFPDYLDWLRAPFMRLLARWLYPEWLQYYPTFWDNKDATSPRGLIGIWLHLQFLWVFFLLFWRDVTVHVVKTTQGVTSVEEEGDHYLIRTESGSYQVQKLILASGNHFMPYPELIPCYPSEKWSGKVQSKKVIIYGGGPSAIETAFHALDSGAAHIVLVTRSGYARIPQLWNEVEYTPLYFTEEAVRQRPIAAQAHAFLIKEWQHFCQVEGVETGDFDQFLTLSDYTCFMQEFIQSCIGNGDKHELRFFAAIGGSFIKLLYGQREEIFPENQWKAVADLFNQYRYLFETISLDGAKRLIGEVEQGKIALLRTADNNAAAQDAIRISAMGISNALPDYLHPLVDAGQIESFPAAKSGMRIHSPHINSIGGLSLRAVERTAKTAIFWLM
jgi:thioredoxin reductase